MITLLRQATLAALLFSLSLAGTTNTQANLSLAEAFQQPPPSARPWVYWMWMDGNLTKTGITADLEAMRKAGIGGAIVMEVNVGIPQGPVKFMSPEWRELFKHVVHEAQRLGLQITLNAGPGWTGSGGPWVKPEQSMQHLVATALDLAGPTNFNDVLPRPQRRPAFFGGALPPDLESAKNEFYADVTVLAFPTPTGGYRIEDIDEKALYVRAPYSSQPGVKAFLPAPAHFTEPPAGNSIPSSQIVDLSARVSADGHLAWAVPAGHWTILRFGRTTTGANTRPAPKPGLGLECDKLDPRALDAHFEQFVGTLLRDLDGRPNAKGAGWVSLHIDSWEMSSQNWTPAFREEFRRRRGYDPFRYLPALTGRVVDSLEVSERFLWDWRQTAQELTIENHAQHLKELGRQHGLGLSIEPYDMMPCADLSFGAVADVPMCEFWLYGFDCTYSVFEAASIAHTGGKPIVAAESFTSTDAERWQAYPGSMKTLGDWAFCSGINRIVFHRYQHQPWLDRAPGMTMGPYGVHWERTQTWWDMVPAYHTYLSRCQFMLRQGIPVADVCFLAAEGAPQVFRPPLSAVEGTPPDHRAYNFDACAPETLIRQATVEKGCVAFPSGARYRVLVLPERQTMTPQLLRKLAELARAGATIVGPPPRQSPSLADYPKCDAEVKQLAAALWPQPAAAGHLARGQVIWNGRNTVADASTPNPLMNAKWIWCAEGNPLAQAPVGDRYFYREIVLPAIPSLIVAQASMTADNAYELRINGRRVGRGDNFNLVGKHDVTSSLRPGTNLVAVKASNGGDAPNPAGLIGSIQLRFQDGRTTEIPTDRQWTATASAGNNWTKTVSTELASTPALELGAYDIAPWRLPARISNEPAQYDDFEPVVQLLAEKGVKPDFEYSATPGPLPLAASSSLSSAPSHLRYVHRRDAAMDVYFVANATDQPLAAECWFRVEDKQPELWDPVTGTRRELPNYRASQGRTGVPLRFEAAQSFFVVFRHAASQRPAGENFPRIQLAGEVTGPWEVQFDPKRGGPGPVTFPSLENWARRPEPGIKFYSGIATYRTTFDRPATLSDDAKTKRRRRWLLDLGEVKNLARVRLNGHDLGVIWCAPWQVDLTDHLLAHANQLEIEVANLWPNRLIGDEQYPPDSDYTSGGQLARWPEWLQKGQPRPSSERIGFSTWKYFRPDDALLPSGLLGPVTLRTEKKP